MFKLTIGIIIFCVICGIIFDGYQRLMQKRADIDNLSWQYKVFSRESSDRISYQVLAARFIPKGAIIQSRDLGVDNVGKGRYGDFKKKGEIIGIRAAADIPAHTFITLDQLETVPLGYEGALTGGSRDFDLSLHTQRVKKKLNAPTTSK
jgi:SAF domain.